MVGISRFFNTIAFAFRNIFRKKIRAFLTILGVAIGVSSVVIIVSIGDNGKNLIANELDSLGLGGLAISTKPNISDVSLSKKNLEVLKTIPAVENSMPVLIDMRETRIATQKTFSVVFGIDNDANKVVSVESLYGRLINRSDLMNFANVCMIDEGTAQRTFKRSNIVGKKIGISFDGGVEEFTVIGIVKTGSGVLQNMLGEMIPQFIYIPYTTMQRLNGKNSFDQICIKIKEGMDVDKASESIIRILERDIGREGVFKSENLAKQREKLDSIFNIITLILSSIGGISLIVAGLGIMTIMIVSVNERTKEIGIKKAIGAKNKTIMHEFMLEALVLSLIGSIIGILVGITVIYSGSAVFSIPVKISYKLISASVLMALVSGVVFGVFPAVKASRLHPTEALRFE